MKEELATLKEITKQNSCEITKLFEISSKLNGAYYKDHEEQLTIKNEMESIHEKLDTIIEKVEYTNGTVRLHTKILYIVGAVAGTLLITNGSPFVQFLTTLVK
jgi:predicted transcriptional regulator